LAVILIWSKVRGGSATRGTSSTSTMPLVADSRSESAVKGSLRRLVSA
jgi:hypothetical protein